MNSLCRFATHVKRIHKGDIHEKTFFVSQYSHVFTKINIFLFNVLSCTLFWSTETCPTMGYRNLVDPGRLGGNSSNISTEISHGESPPSLQVNSWQGAVDMVDGWGEDGKPRDFHDFLMRTFPRWWFDQFFYRMMRSDADAILCLFTCLFCFLYLIFFVFRICMTNHWNILSFRR